MSKLTAEEYAVLPTLDFGDPANRKFPIVDQDDVNFSASDMAGVTMNVDSFKRRVLTIAKRKNLQVPETWAKETAKMAADISSDDLRQRLQDAIEDEFYGSESTEADAGELDRYALNSIWIVDVFPLSSTFVYRWTEGDIYRRNYHMAENGEVTLLGSPVEVTRVTTYVPAQGTEIPISQFSKSGDDLIYEGEIFRAGDYEDKKVKASLQDCLNLATRAFSKILPVKIQHTGTAFDKALAGYGVEQIEARDGGAWLWGRARFPGWLKDALGDEFSVSVGMDRTGTTPEELTELSIVDYGRIPTAKLVAAFSAQFAGKRNSGGDQSLIQTMHDHAVSLGATCGESDTKGASKMALTDPDNKNKMVNPVLQKLQGMKPEDLAALNLTPEELTAAFAVGSTTQTQANPDVEARIASMEAELNRQRDINLHNSAVSFAKSMIYSKTPRALPAEMDDLVSIFKMAALADGENGQANFAQSGGVDMDGVNVKLFTDSVSKRSPLAAFETAIPNDRPSDDASFATSEREEETKSSVFAGTALGRKAAELAAARKEGKK